MYKIEEGLYQGGVYPLLNDELPEKITAIVSLNLNTEPQASPGHIQARVSLPIEDGPWPGMKWLKTAVSIIEALVKDHEIYIHCKAGISRSTMLVAAYLMKKHYCSLDQAMEKIAAANPKLHPNVRFMQGLKDWYQYLRSN